MIALTIGLVILIAVSSLFIGNRQTFRATDDKTRLDEEGRLALNLIATQIRMAGYGTLLSAKESIANDLTNRNDPLLETSFRNAEDAIRGCRFGFVDPSASVIACAGAGAGAADSISISRDVDQVSTLVPNGGLTAADCLGSNVPLTASQVVRPGDPEVAQTGPYFRITNRFFIRNNPATGNPELYCQGNGNTALGAPNFAIAAQPIAENVEMMRVFYGVSTDLRVPRPIANQFLPADTVETVLGAFPERWGRVVSVRVCLIVRSANNNVVTSPQTYRDCTDQQVVATDRRLRGVFSTTVAIRSRSIGAT
jgi:type IV pilus assembly protein PilW